MTNKSYMQHVPSFKTLEITDYSLYIFLVVLISKRTINVLAMNTCQWLVCIETYTCSTVLKY